MLEPAEHPQPESEPVEFLGSLREAIDEAFRDLYPLSSLRLERVLVHLDPERTAPRALRGGTLGLYDPLSAVIHLSPQVIADLDGDDPVRGRQAVHAIAHELFHASEPRLRPDQFPQAIERAERFIPERCSDAEIEARMVSLDEGLTESLTRLYGPYLMRRVGLWQERFDGLERQVRLAYDLETEIVSALAAAASGELDLDALQRGAYRSPTACGPRTRALLLELRASVSVAEAFAELAERCCERLGRRDRSRYLLYCALSLVERDELQWSRRGADWQPPSPAGPLLRALFE